VKILALPDFVYSGATMPARIFNVLTQNMPRHPLRPNSFVKKGILAIFELTKNLVGDKAVFEQHVVYASGQGSPALKKPVRASINFKREIPRWGISSGAERK